MKNILLVFLSVAFLIFIPIISINAECDPRDATSDEICLENPIEGNPSPEIIIGKIINAILGITGSLALAMFVYGGFLWMMSGGNQERVTKGKNTIIWAALGLAVIFSSYAIVNFEI